MHKAIDPAHSVNVSHQEDFTRQEDFTHQGNATYLVNATHQINSHEPRDFKTSFAYLDELSKRAIRRAVLKAVSIPGYQVPFSSRELPIARGWGTGGLQLTLTTITDDDTLKVIDQGTDESVNAVSIKKFITQTSGVPTTIWTHEATIIQSRHRIPETPLREDQLLILQVPLPEPLRRYEPSEAMTRRYHAEGKYDGIWTLLLEDIIQYGHYHTSTDHPVLVHERYVMAPSPIPRHDLAKLHQAANLTLFGAGREKKIYAVPPYTDVIPLAFFDVPLEHERMTEKTCRLCGASGVYMDTWIDPQTGEVSYQCNDTAFCLWRRNHPNSPPSQSTKNIPSFSRDETKRPETYLSFTEGEKAPSSLTPLVRAMHVTVRYGEGCAHCRDKTHSLEHHSCPYCGTIYALRDVSFNLYPGEVLGIVGESGSGKSTLLNALALAIDQKNAKNARAAIRASHDHPHVDVRGDIRFAFYHGGQKNVLHASLQEKRRLQDVMLGVVYQDATQSLHMHLSALANVSEKLITLGLRDVRTMLERSKAFLGKVQIPEERVKQPPRLFSGGMRQRVQIARALVTEPPLLLLDEVTTGLDLTVQASVLDLLRHLHLSEQLSMIIVSHDLHVIRMLADRTLVMFEGQIIEEGMTDQILDDPQKPFTQKLVRSLL